MADEAPGGQVPGAGPHRPLEVCVTPQRTGPCLGPRERRLTVDLRSSAGCVWWWWAVAVGNTLQFLSCEAEYPWRGAYGSTMGPLGALAVAPSVLPPMGVERFEQRAREVDWDGAF